MTFQRRQKMEMRASEDIGIGQDLTPALPPLALSLYDSSLLSHCSACFSPLSPPPQQFPPLLPTFPANTHLVSHPSVLYCSPQCSKADSDIHLSSAEHHLLHSELGALWPQGSGDTSDLRAALRLLRCFEDLNLISRQNSRLERIGGLMSNRDELMSRRNEEGDGEFLASIRDGAKAMAMARRRRDGLDLDFESSAECVVEEVVLCVVLTNAVEVQVNGGPAVGIAVYNTTFSWINHSCSPNACYRFSLQECSGAESQLSIVPAITGSDVVDVIENGVCFKCETTKGSEGYGPKIIVRSIKVINKGDEVSVAYTDLLQPKETRQSELWLKYRFICSCWRCSSWPPTYVDNTLREIFAVNCNGANLNLVHNFYRDEPVKRLTDYVDDAITEYLTFGNSKSCCEKLENLLIYGLLDGQFESKEEKLKRQLWLHPLHHLSLNAYTTLASAYKIRASDFLALDPEKDELQLEAFNMSRTSAAYSLLLGAATHHLFLSEFSLIASVANFWMNTGESLLNLARSSVLKLFAKWGSTISEYSSLPSYKCCKCALIDKFERNFVVSQAQNAEFEDVSREFLDCITSITPKVWSFLIYQGCYLKLIEDPIDFGWVGTMKSFRILGFEANLSNTNAEISVSKCEPWTHVDPENIIQLGVHCLLYGCFLSSIFCGHQPHLIHYIQNLLYG